MMEQWQSAEINELIGALVKAQFSLKPASKDCTNPFYHSKYADLATVWASLRGFSDVGIAIIQAPMDSPDGFIVLDTILAHTSGQWMRSRLKMRVSKDDPQGAGSALTYARRYALGCMTGLVTEEDDDGNAAVSRSPVMQNKATAQAKIQELRESAAAPTQEYRVKIGRQKGALLSEQQDESLAWCLDYYRSKLQTDPGSRYVNEWSEAVFLMEEELQRRQEA